MSLSALDANLKNGTFVHPCIHKNYGSLIECTNISTGEIRTAFQDSYHIGVFTPSMVILAPLAEDENDPKINIPRDLFGIYCVGDRVIMDCFSRYRLVVHPDAFRFSGNCTTWLDIENCDLNSTNFAFLASFKQLVNFQIYNCHHVGHATWSGTKLVLTNLARFSIWKSSGLNNWTQFPHFTQGLKTASLAENGIGNEAMDRILEWLSSFSANTLEDLWIRENALTRIPQPLSPFTALKVLDMRKQKAPGLGSIPAGALHLSSSVSLQMLELGECGIINIEPGAIQGAIKLQTRVFQKEYIA